ncbi:OmpA family protein [Methylotenera sp. N17]|jgi:OOP family OmpA-OmpF porin|uniref:OmpA family protein n=1 Tax=Methylotenera sp. N17 TaxID=1502761 RepID=UPI000647D96D|nr:OmpA family protein [Methylotenera sp. N17]
MKKSLMSFAVAAALGVTAFTATAEDMYRGAWYAVPGISYMHTDSDLEADNGAGGFLSIGKELSQSWDLQGRLGYNRADEDTGIAGAGGKYKQTTLGLDALYMFSRDKFRPFLLAGIGAARNNVDYSGLGLTDKTKTSWLAGLGLGAQYLFSDSFGIQADLRHQWSKAEAKNAARTVDADETIGNTLFNVGGIFRFGAPAPVVAEAAPEPAPIAAAPEPAPAPAAEPAPAPVACKPQTETITVGAEKLFGFDKAKLKDEGKAALDEAAAKIKANPEIKAVIVTGHTDRIGSDAYNQKLSERRAKQVADYLVAQGVDSSLITATGKGESEPVVQCEGNKATKKLISCLQPNRRVEIRAEGTKEVGCN